MSTLSGPQVLGSRLYLHDSSLGSAPFPAFVSHVSADGLYANLAVIAANGTWFTRTSVRFYSPVPSPAPTGAYCYPPPTS